MALKQVELVRRRVASGVGNEIVRLRSWISSIDGNADAVETLRGDNAEQLLGTLIETIMVHLGHGAEVNRLNDGHSGRQSKALRAARGAVNDG